MSTTFSLLRLPVVFLVFQVSLVFQEIPEEMACLAHVVQLARKESVGERGNDYVDLVKSNWKQCVRKRQDDKNSVLIQVLDLEIQNYEYWTHLHWPTLLGSQW